MLEEKIEKLDSILQEMKYFPSVTEYLSEVVIREYKKDHSKIIAEIRENEVILRSTEGWKAEYDGKAHYDGAVPDKIKALEKYFL